MAASPTLRSCAVPSDRGACPDLHRLHGRVVRDPFEPGQRSRHAHHLPAAGVPPDSAFGAFLRRLAALEGAPVAFEGGMAPSRVIASAAEGGHGHVEGPPRLLPPSLRMPPDAHRDAHDEVEARTFGIGRRRHRDDRAVVAAVLVARGRERDQLDAVEGPAPGPGRVDTSALRAPSSPRS